MPILLEHLFNLIVPSPSELLEGFDSSDGIYYIVRSPSRWEVLPCNFEKMGDDTDHQELWQSQVVPILAQAWYTKLKVSRDKLEAALMPLHYAFPRGRIEKDGFRYFHMHGNNQQFIGLDRIERYFGVQGKAKREIDGHEMCDKAQCTKLRKLLKLTDTWPTA